MPRLKNIVPSYRLHRQSGQAIVTLSGRDYLLGPHGTPSSRTKYNRLVAEWLSNDRQPLATDGLTIGELAARYWSFVAKYYVKDGQPTKEQSCIKMALRPLLKLYEHDLATNFGPVALRTVRDEMLTYDWTRQSINGSIDRIRRMFRWAEAEEILSGDSISHRLATLTGLRKGRCEARDSEPIRPIDDAKVKATLPHLPEVVADMVRVQRLTGMRPQEVCVMRPCDVHRGRDVWTYRPESHKTQHHGKARVVYIGPQAQAILLRYLARDAEAYCFQPRDSEAKRRAIQHATRKTPLSCGNRPGSNRKRAPKRSPSHRYDVNAYRRAIHRACDKAFPLPDELMPPKGPVTANWVKGLGPTAKIALAKHYAEHRWSPNRLRHSAATEIRQQFGLEAAQVILGHSKADVTQVYAERDLSRALEVARRIG